MATKLKMLLSVIVILFFISCATSKLNSVGQFQNLNYDFTKLDHTYVNISDSPKRYYDGSSLLRFFHSRDIANSVTLSFINKDSVRLRYWHYTDSGTVLTEKYYKGKSKKKYFEIYHQKKRIDIPFIYGYTNIDRLRLGQAKDGSLLLMNLVERNGYIFIMSAGYSYNYGYLFDKEHTTGKPCAYYDTAALQWGLLHTDSTTLLHPQYDFIYNFRTTVAVVIDDGKYGLLHKNGTLVSPIIYDSIALVKNDRVPSYFMIKQNNYWGLYDSLGKQLLPIEYDEIEVNYGYGYRLKQHNKFGFLTNEGDLIPAVYDSYLYFQKMRAQDTTLEVAEVTRDNETYYIDKYGYRYDIKLISGFFNDLKLPKVETKQKIQY